MEFFFVCLWDGFVGNEYIVEMGFFFKNNYFNKIEINLDNRMDDNFESG